MGSLWAGRSCEMQGVVSNGGASDPLGDPSCRLEGGGFDFMRFLPELLWQPFSTVGGSTPHADAL